MSCCAWALEQDASPDPILSGVIEPAQRYYAEYPHQPNYARNQAVQGAATTESYSYGTSANILESVGYSIWI